MTAMLLQLSLCVVTVIQLTSSQSAFDVTLQDSDVSSRGRIQQVLNQLASQIRHKGNDYDGNNDAGSRNKGRLIDRTAHEHFVSVAAQKVKQLKSDVVLLTLILAAN